jgi:hypothetical protein
MYCDSA